jgi:hypothetical protein
LFFSSSSSGSLSAAVPKGRMPDKPQVALGAFCRPGCQGDPLWGGGEELIKTALGTAPSAASRSAVPPPPAELRPPLPPPRSRQRRRPRHRRKQHQAQGGQGKLRCRHPAATKRAVGRQQRRRREQHRQRARCGGDAQRSALCLGWSYLALLTTALVVSHGYELNNSCLTETLYVTYVYESAIHAQDMCSPVILAPISRALTADTRSMAD